MVVRFNIVFIQFFLHWVSAPELTINKDDIILFCLCTKWKSFCEGLVQVITETAVIISISAISDCHLFVFLDLCAINICSAALEEIVLHFICTIITACIECHTLLRECSRPVACYTYSYIFSKFELALFKYLYIAGTFPCLAFRVVICRVFIASNIKIRIKAAAVLPTVVLITDHINTFFFIKEVAAVSWYRQHLHVFIIWCGFSYEVTVCRNFAVESVAVPANRSYYHALVNCIVRRFIASEWDIAYSCKLIRIVCVIAYADTALILFCRSWSTGIRTVKGIKHSAAAAAWYRKIECWIIESAFRREYRLFYTIYSFSWTVCSSRSRLEQCHTIRTVWGPSIGNIGIHLRDLEFIKFCSVRWSKIDSFSGCTYFECCMKFSWCYISIITENNKILTCSKCCTVRECEFEAVFIAVWQSYTAKINGIITCII